MEDKNIKVAFVITTQVGEKNSHFGSAKAVM